MTEKTRPAIPDGETEPEDEGDMTPSEKFLNIVEGDLFGDVVTRAAVLDVILKKKILTKSQVAKILKLRPAIEKVERVLLPATIGLCLAALGRVDGDDKDRPADAPTPIADVIEDNAEEAVKTFIANMAKRRLTRFEKLGPLSYPLV